jgi:hypothetical protein
LNFPGRGFFRKWLTIKERAEEMRRWSPPTIQNEEKKVFCEVESKISKEHIH